MKLFSFKSSSVVTPKPAVAYRRPHLPETGTMRSCVFKGVVTPGKGKQWQISPLDPLPDWLMKPEPKTKEKDSVPVRIFPLKEQGKALPQVELGEVLSCLVTEYDVVFNKARNTPRFAFAKVERDRKENLVSKLSRLGAWRS